MGLLSADYYKDLIKESQALPSFTPSATQGPSEKIEKMMEGAAPKFNPYESYIQNAPRPLVAPGIDPKLVSPSTPFRAYGDIDEAAQIERFGGPVGSVEYYRYKADHPFISFFPTQVISSLGIQLPDMESWDKMRRLDQLGHIGGMGFAALIRLIPSLPREIFKATPRFLASVAQPWVTWARTGKMPTAEELGKAPVVEVPWLGAVPNYWQTYYQARESGIGPLAATLSTGSLALGDIVIAGSLAEAFQKALQPRAAIKEGQPVKNTGPIQSALVKEQKKLALKGVLKRKSSSEYYRLPKSTAKDFGGNTNNTFLKLTPAGADSVEIAVVQTRGGIISKAIDWTKDKFGVNKTYKGDFGPEIKVQSEIVRFSGPKIIPKVAPAFVKQAGLSELENLRAELNILDDTIKIHPAFTLTKYAKPGKTELPEVVGLTRAEKAAGIKVGEFGKRGDAIITELGFKDTAQAAAAYEELVRLRQQRVTLQAAIKSETIKIGEKLDTALEQASLAKTAEIEAQIEASLAQVRGAIIKPIPPAALKGFENKAITFDQIDNLNLIARVNGIEPGIQDAVMRTVTGKKVVGELTQAEYAKTAQTLASFNNLNKYAPDSGAVNIFTQYGSPQRHWMRTYEEKSGVPLYSEAYVPMEEAIRLRSAFRDSYRNQAREIFGKYAKAGFYEERRLIKNYMEGNTGAILDNIKLSSAVKKELIDVANKIRPLYDKLGNLFDIPTEVFLKDYQPHVQELGGVFQIYKEGQAIPKELTFFAKFKRHGSLENQIDDSLALFDIYTNAGSNKLFLNPALERIGALGEKLPLTLQNSLRSYVGEKLGYAGKLEEFLNNVAQNVNQRLGTNLPPDAARQATQLVMDTTYSGAMGLNPGTVMRNALQYDLLSYPRLGPNFYGEALKTALTKEGMAEVRNAGFLVELGVPYGQELAQEVTLFGKAGNLYRQATQATLAPFSAVESLNRARTYWQVKYQFNNTLAKYNAGKLTWTQFEKEMDFVSLSPLDRNIIRQRLVSGDIKGAFENLVRDIIDETQFPYRAGASSRITYGLTGRLGTQFGQWNIEFVHTLGSWIKQFAQGNPDKLIRFAASSYAIQRTLEDTLGFDFTRSIGAGPFNANFSPFIKTSIDMVEWINAMQAGNADAINENADDIARTLKALGRPLGVEIQYWNNFLTSYNKGPIGPNGTYGVFDQRGRLKYYTTFDDIFWQAFGFPTKEKEEFARQKQSIQNAMVEYSQVKRTVLELYQQEKYDEANQIINDYGITLDPSDFDQYYIPFTDRTFKKLPPALKSRFAPTLYPAK